MAPTGSRPRGPARRAYRRAAERTPRRPPHAAAAGVRPRLGKGQIGAAHRSRAPGPARRAAATCNSAPARFLQRPRAANVSTRQRHRALATRRPIDTPAQAVHVTPKGPAPPARRRGHRPRCPRQQGRCRFIPPSAASALLATVLVEMAGDDEMGPRRPAVASCPLRRVPSASMVGAHAARPAAAATAPARAAPSRRARRRFPPPARAGCAARIARQAAPQGRALSRAERGSTGRAAPPLARFSRSTRAAGLAIRRAFQRSAARCAWAEANRAPDGASGGVIKPFAAEICAVRTAVAAERHSLPWRPNFPSVRVYRRLEPLLVTRPRRRPVGRSGEPGKPEVCARLRGHEKAIPAAEEFGRWYRRRAGRGQERAARALAGAACPSPGSPPAMPWPRRLHRGAGGRSAPRYAPERKKSSRVEEAGTAG